MIATGDWHGADGRFFAGAALRSGDADGEDRADDRDHDTRIWQIVEHHVNAARDQLDCSGMRRVRVDEASAAKGQDNVGVVKLFDDEGVRGSFG